METSELGKEFPCEGSRSGSRTFLDSSRHWSCNRVNTTLQDPDPISITLVSIVLPMLDFGPFVCILVHSILQMHEALCKLDGIVIIHCREEGCIGKYAPRGSRDLPKQGFCTPRPERVMSDTFATSHNL